MDITPTDIIAALAGVSVLIREGANFVRALRGNGHHAPPPRPELHASPDTTGPHIVLAPQLPADLERRIAALESQKGARAMPRNFVPIMMLSVLAAISTAGTMLGEGIAYGYILSAAALELSAGVAAAYGIDAYRKRSTARAADRELAAKGPYEPKGRRGFASGRALGITAGIALLTFAAISSPPTMLVSIPAVAIGVPVLALRGRRAARSTWIGLLVLVLGVSGCARFFDVLGGVLAGAGKAIDIVKKLVPPPDSALGAAVPPELAAAREQCVAADVAIEACVMGEGGAATVTCEEDAAYAALLAAAGALEAVADAAEGLVPALAAEGGGGAGGAP